MGRYAVGGSAAIYKYDAARWDQEQKERQLMGMAVSSGMEGISMENFEALLGRGGGADVYMDNGQGYDLGMMGAAEGENE